MIASSTGAALAKIAANPRRVVMSVDFILKCLVVEMEKLLCFCSTAERCEIRNWKEVIHWEIS